MRRPSPRMFQMGPEYEILREGRSVARIHGLHQKDSDGKYVNFPHDIDLQVGDTLLVRATGERLPVLKIEPNIQGSGIQSKNAYTQLTAPVEQCPHVSTTWNVENAGVIAGRDIHGGVTVGIIGRELLEGLRKKLEDADIPVEEKKTLLQEVGDLAMNPRILDLGEIVFTKVKDALGY